MREKEPGPFGFTVKTRVVPPVNSHMVENSLKLMGDYPAFPYVNVNRRKLLLVSQWDMEGP